MVLDILLPEKDGRLMFITLLSFLLPVAAATELPPVDSPDAIPAAEIGHLTKPFGGNAWVWDRYFGGAPISTHVCEYMDRARDTSDHGILNLKIAGYRIASGQKPGDPYVETFLGPARTLLNHPATRRLLELVIDQERRDAPPDVYRRLFLGSLATSAGLELLEDHYTIEASCDRSYLLLMLLRTLRERPDLIRSPEARSLCRDLEAGFAGDDPPTDEQRGQLDRFIARSEIDPRKIGYDRATRSRIEMHWRGFVPVLRIPWMREALFGER
jgi:hypothetical protein